MLRPYPIAAGATAAEKSGDRARVTWITQGSADWMPWLPGATQHETAPVPAQPPPKPVSPTKPLASSFTMPWSGVNIREMCGARREAPREKLRSNEQSDTGATPLVATANDDTIIDTLPIVKGMAYEAIGAHHQPLARCANGGVQHPPQNGKPPQQPAVPNGMQRSQPPTPPPLLPPTQQPTSASWTQPMRQPVQTPWPSSQHHPQPPTHMASTHPLREAATGVTTEEGGWPVEIREEVFSPTELVRMLADVEPFDPEGQEPFDEACLRLSQDQDPFENTTRHPAPQQLACHPAPRPTATQAAATQAAAVPSVAPWPSASRVSSDASHPGAHFGAHQGSQGPSNSAGCGVPTHVPLSQVHCHGSLSHAPTHGAPREATYEPAGHLRFAPSHHDPRRSATPLSVCRTESMQSHGSRSESAHSLREPTVSDAPLPTESSHKDNAAFGSSLTEAASDALEVLEAWGLPSPTSETTSATEGDIREWGRKFGSPAAVAHDSGPRKPQEGEWEFWGRLFGPPTITPLVQPAKRCRSSSSASQPNL